ncbi:cytochrome P450 [Favolaschia claudopus]|uniref:Cytochrome P450 n=1 Tax=Favolaschia claudopus TaxID=2862362 RepID=A0AAV9ZNC7_9AGAR
MFVLTTFDAVFGVVALALWYHLYTRQGSPPLPPGPKRWPVIGNLLDMPRSHAWKTFSAWAEVYGGIVGVKLIGQSFVILNDRVIMIAAELLNKKVNADRPLLHMANLSGWESVLSSARYGSRFRAYRKLIAQVIGNRTKMENFYPTLEYQANMFLKRVLSNPEGFDMTQATRKTAGAVVLKVTYGYVVKEDGNDSLVDLADKALLEFSEITRPGAFLVDLIPVLRHIPSWFPGAGFKRRAERYRKSIEEMAQIPLEYVQSQMSEQTAAQSFTSDLLKDGDVSPNTPEEIKWSAASFYGAGADTTVSVVMAYFLAAAQYPCIQRAAQAEMDTVVGTKRLPTFGRTELPCRAQQFNVGVPHRAMEDDIYNGYLIPKGSLVIANVWKFLHDPKEYKDPFEFNPDRFLGVNAEPDPKHRGVFGYGPRGCPGEHLADIAVWISVAKAIAGLNIARARDANGKEIDPVADTTDGTISCEVTPRSDVTMTLVMDALSN